MPQKLAALLLCLLIANPLPAQDADKRDVAATMSVKVKVVTLPVTVRDKHGALVNTLTKDDFTLQEDGRPQSIRYFTQEKDLPLTLGLLVDTSLSQRNVLDEERAASKKFLDDMLTESKDQAFLIHFDREVELLEDLTASREKLRAALEDLHTPPMDRGNSGGSNDPNSDPDSRSARRAGTLLYDAIYLASDELMKKQKGRKALVILTDGVDRGSKKTLEDAVEAAQRADTVVYTVLFTGEERGGFARGGDRGHDTGGRRGGGWPGGGGGGGWPGGGTGWPGGGGGGRRPSGGGGGGQRHPEEPRADGKKVLDQIARETGGRLYEVSKKEKIDQIYASIAEELRTQYSLAYTPDKENSGSGYHRLTLTTKKSDLTVQTREGYYAD